MRYPVGDSGSLQEYQRDWYDAQPFGSITSYGRHEGADMNLKTGGSTDLGKEIKAIANGKIVYYHRTSHPTTGFGRHKVQKIDGAWGTRWVHYAHLLDTDFAGTLGDVLEGQIIGRLGNSGTASPHLHFAILKVDPVSVGIDNVANNETELNQYWEDPIAFINKWIAQPAPTPTPTPSPVTDQSLYNFGTGYGILELQAARSILQEQRTRIATLETEKTNLQNQYNSLKTRIKTAVNNAIDQTN